MGSTASVYLVVMMAVGGAAGWHLRRAQAAHGDIKTYKSRIPGFRKMRNHSTVMTAVILVMAVLALRAILA